MNLWPIVCLIVFLIVAVITTELVAVRHNWTGTSSWAKKLNNWIESFKKKPAVTTAYAVNLQRGDGSIDEYKFSTLAEREQYLTQVGIDWENDPDSIISIEIFNYKCN